MRKVYYVTIKGRTLESRDLKELLARAVTAKRNSGTAGSAGVLAGSVADSSRPELALQIPVQAYRSSNADGFCFLDS